VGIQPEKRGARKCGAQGRESVCAISLDDGDVGMVAEAAPGSLGQARIDFDRGNGGEGMELGSNHVAEEDPSLDQGRQLELPAIGADEILLEEGGRGPFGQASAALPEPEIPGPADTSVGIEERGPIKKCSQKATNHG